MINYPKKASPSLLVLIGIPAGILFSVFSFLQIGFNFQDFKNNLSNRYLVTDPLFNPKWAWAWENSSDALVETIQIAILASIIGCAVALPLSFYASRATNLNKYSYFVYKSFLNLVRTIPDLFWAMIFTVAILLILFLLPLLLLSLFVPMLLFRYCCCCCCRFARGELVLVR